MNITEKINKLIEHHTEARIEVNELLKELHAVNLGKVSEKEKEVVTGSIIKAFEEYTYRGIFIDELKNLLDE